MKFSNEIIIGADFHLSKEHFKYLKEPFEFFIKEIQRKKPLIVVIDGDYFDDRVNADEDIFHYAIQNLLLISLYAKHIIVIEGTFSHDYNSLDILNTYNDFIPNLYL